MCCSLSGSFGVESERLVFLRGGVAIVVLALDRSDGRVDPLFFM